MGLVEQPYSCYRREQTKRGGIDACDEQNEPKKKRCLETDVRYTTKLEFQSSSYSSRRLITCSIVRVRSLISTSSRAWSKELFGKLFDFRTHSTGHWSTRRIRHLLSKVSFPGSSRGG